MTVVIMIIARFRLSEDPTEENSEEVAVAIPLLSGGADSIMELEIGELNSPVPIPNSTMYPITRERLSELVSVEKRSTAMPCIARPETVKGLRPYLSENRPLSGPVDKTAIWNGTNVRPACEGEKPRTSCKYRLRRIRTAPQAIALKSIAIELPANCLIRNRPRSSIGLLALLS